MGETTFCLLWICIYSLLDNPLIAQQISCGGEHSLFICSDSSVYASGANYSGQLGIDSIKSSIGIFTRIKNLNNIIEVSAGYEYSLALKSDGTVWAWGDNSYGQLGNNSLLDIRTPTQIQKLKDIIAISAGWTHSIALKKDGTVWCWGNNDSGQIGNGTNDPAYVPIKVPGLSKVIKVKAEWQHSIALLEDGTVWGWGNNQYGQLGDSSFINHNEPNKFHQLSSVIDIASGVFHTLFLKKDRTVWSCGGNGWGQLGTNNYLDSNIPTKISLLNNIVSIYSSGVTSFAINNEGKLLGWGCNYEAQLADSSLGQKSATPHSIFLKTIYFSAGYNDCFLVNSERKLQGWGENTWGKLGASTNSYYQYHPIEILTSCEISINCTRNAYLNQFTKICSNSSPITLTGGTPEKGTYTGTAVTSGKFFPFAAGVGDHTITYTYTDSSGCSSSADAIIKVEDCTGIGNNPKIKNHFSVYPNPTNGRISVSSSGTPAVIVIKDLLGRTVFERQTKSEQETIDLSSQPKGIYFLQMESGEAKEVRKIVVE